MEETLAATFHLIHRFLVSSVGIYVKAARRTEEVVIEARDRLRRDRCASVRRQREKCLEGAVFAKLI